MAVRILTIHFILFIHKASECYADPCNPINHRKFPSVRMGSRNQHCDGSPDNLVICDYYLKEDWYVAEDAVLLNTCPKLPQSCSVSYPAFLDGYFPDESDGIVNKTVCIKQRSDCCKETIPIQLKNCSGFYVYHLKPLRECSSAYCFESSLPCLETTTSTISGTTVRDTKEHRNRDDITPVIIGTTVSVGVVLCVIAIAVAAFVIKNGWIKPQTRVAIEKGNQVPADSYNRTHIPNYAEN